MLKVGRRYALIVLDSVLSDASITHMMICKKIIEGNSLEALLPIPSGLFISYARVSTTVLDLQRDQPGWPDNVWFYDMRSHMGERHFGHHRLFDNHAVGEGCA